MDCVQTEEVSEVLCARMIAAGNIIHDIISICLEIFKSQLQVKISCKFIDGFLILILLLNRQTIPIRLSP